MSFFLLCSVEEKEEEDGDDGNGCRALAAWESDWRKTSVFAISLSQNISFRNKVLLQGRMGWAPILIWFVCLISDRINPTLISGFNVLLSWLHV